MKLALLLIIFAINMSYQDLSIEVVALIGFTSPDVWLILVCADRELAKYYYNNREYVESYFLRTNETNTLTTLPNKWYHNISDLHADI
jgi:hypothetical protein